MLDFLRGFVRPFIAYTGWIVALCAFIYIIVKFLDAGIARDLAIGVMVLITAVVNSYIGSRKPK